MTDNNEKRMITVEGKVRKFKVGEVEINTIDESMTDEDYDAVKYLLSLDTSDMVSLIAKVVDFKALGNENSVIKTSAGDRYSYKSDLIEEIKFWLS